MKRLLLSLVIAIAATQAAFAQYDFLRPVKDSIPGGYDFWVYTPQDYYYSLEATPVVIFLHGRSLCGSMYPRRGVSGRRRQDRGRNWCTLAFGRAACLRSFSLSLSRDMRRHGRMSS